MAKVAVMGAGSWGTTVAKVCADAGGDVTLWARRAEIATEINDRHTNSTYLREIILPEGLTATTDPAAALDGAGIVFLGVPSQTMRTNLAAWRERIGEDATVVSLTKGIEHHSRRRMSQVIAEVADIPESRVAVLSGPNLAYEIAGSQPAATVVACTDAERAVAVQEATAAPYFRPYTNDDVIGCEIAGACKNIIALACGMGVGMGLGHNSNATLITRGLAEITRLAVALGGSERTMSGLAGLGDLVATCNSPLSRNRSFGERLGRGESLDQAREATHGQVAEGVVSSIAVSEIARENSVDMPITDAVVDVCHHGGSVTGAVRSLLGRTRKAE
ncbi:MULTISPECIES: NAD(P)H-dependent glycerol-3-phosphate dehydrogenase [Corynebacterium]|jgi:glycerol-3-phosphate dehydrogenase (NAD(P)+)|uniref:Glycerol-3-phosphate dehydrogenase [NAD(P)+] n=1 Tax=Corynebacterium provencense TaxID=1737425 RepID=A0A2Z3YV45_9CORY|nr:MULTISPECIES: NAD(P)H-dependent glycerol-3-phosphate dehydrogenase [Corynebacterium]AWT25917.1 Glycerol-3-phosphate dehydrogenase [NAD(P)+] [Corynebacterium provencense]MCI1255920.1 NAD(P)-dependent glycerol-3-phosphate dehydrogenase [Corynebacterium provencense]